MKPATFAVVLGLTAAASTAFGLYMLPGQGHIQDAIDGKVKLRTDFFGITDRYKKHFAPEQP